MQEGRVDKQIWRKSIEEGTMEKEEQGNCMPGVFKGQQPRGHPAAAMSRVLEDEVNKTRVAMASPL
jgi:hypothetical protein